MKLKDMTIGQRLVVADSIRRGVSRKVATRIVLSPVCNDKKLAAAIDREVRKVAERFFENGKSSGRLRREGNLDAHWELIDELHTFNRPKKPAKKGAGNP